MRVYVLVFDVTNFSALPYSGSSKRVAQIFVRWPEHVKFPVLPCDAGVLRTALFAVGGDGSFVSLSSFVLSLSGSCST